MNSKKTSSVRRACNFSCGFSRGFQTLRSRDRLTDARHRTMIVGIGCVHSYFVFDIDIPDRL